MIRRYCAQDGGCSNPDCHLCRTVARLPQPPTYLERKQREEYRKRVDAMKKGRKK